MCYKEERHRHLSIALSEKLKDVPDFIADFFDRYDSATTKNCNWGYIRDLLQWLIDQNYIQKENISEITKDDMDKITDSHIIKYMDGLSLGINGRKNSKISLCTKKNVFSSFWNYMVYNEYIRKNVVSNIPKKKYKPENTNKEVFVPTNEQVEKFICNLNDGNNNEFDIIRNLAIVKLIMGSGIRSEELINLDVKDLHLNGGKRIGSNDITARPFIDVLGKGKREEYTSVCISPDVVGYIEDYLKQRDIFVRENNIEDNALFLSNNKRRISKTSITSFFNRYSNGEIFPHALRHWVGTKLYEDTKDILVVQEQLRHSNLETARKYYVHMDKSIIEDAMARLQII